MSEYSFDDRPFDYLLDLKTRSQWDAFHPKYSGWWTLAFALIFVFCTSWNSFHNDIKPSLAIAVALGLLHLMVLWPLQRIVCDAHTVGSLLGKKAFEELQVSLARPHQICDSVAYYSLRTVLRECAPKAAVGLTMVCLIYADTVNFQAAIAVLLSFLAWTAALAFGGSCISYGAQLHSLLKQRLIARLVLPVALFALLLNIGYGLAIVSGELFRVVYGVEESVAEAALSKLFVVLLLTLLSSVFLRRLSAGLYKESRSDQNQSRRERSPWVANWGQNPIVFRERKRLASQVPMSLAAATLWQLPLITVLIGMAFLLPSGQMSLDCHLLLFYSAAIVQFGRGVLATRLAVASEVEAQTDSILAGTPLSSTGFVLGWLQVSLLPLLFESSLATGLLISEAGQPLHLVTKAALFLLLSPFLGCTLGLSASCASSHAAAENKLINHLTFNILNFLGSLFVSSFPWTAECKGHINVCIILFFLVIVPLMFILSTYRWLNSRFSAQVGN